jgi:DNA primase
MSAEFLAHALKARRSGSAWMAPCPAHEDCNPSLSIGEVGGKVLLHCHGGCSQREVIAALEARGLWESRATLEPKRRIVAEYSYTDEHGKLLYQVVRFLPKDFRPRYPDGRGGWVWRKHPRQVLYRLREVLEAPIVFVVEGEKDVETLRAYGFVATTASGGARAPWLPGYTAALAGREIIVVPDNDVPGRQRALIVARALLDKVARLIVWEPEGVKDITEWFGRGHG